MRLLEHKNPFIRKGTAAFFQIAKLPLRLTLNENDYRDCPIFIVNSIPKSGTHMLLQMVRALPGTRYLGAFVAHAWSITLRERTPGEICMRLSWLIPREVAGAHIKYHPMVAEFMHGIPVVHLFIYRDPRDIILSEEAYLSQMAPWHRLSRVLRRNADREARIRLLIEGIPGLYEDIGTRIRMFSSWLLEKNVISVRYEDLWGETRSRAIGQLSENIFMAAPVYGPPKRIAEHMNRAIIPKRSHTFREGGTEKWRRQLSKANLERIMKFAGDAIVDLGYPET